MYLYGILFSYILSEILYNAESQCILEFSKDNVSILYLSFITKMDLFRVMLLTILLCKMAFSCINPHKNTECYPVMLSRSIKEIAPTFDGCSFLGLIIKKDNVLKHFHFYRNECILSNSNNMPRS